MIAFPMICEERRRRQYSFSTGERQVDACAGLCPGFHVLKPETYREACISQADHLFQEDWTKLKTGSDYRSPFRHLTFWQGTCCSQWKVLSLLEAQNGSTQPKGLARTVCCRSE